MLQSTVVWNFTRTSQIIINCEASLTIRFVGFMWYMRLMCCNAFGQWLRAKCSSLLTFLNCWTYVATIQEWREPVRRAGSNYNRFLGYSIYYGPPEAIRESKRVSCRDHISRLSFHLSKCHSVALDTMVIEWHSNLPSSISEFDLWDGFLFAAGLRKILISIKTWKLVFLRRPSGTHYDLPG